MSRALPNADTAIESAEQGIAILTEEIAALETEKGVTEVTDHERQSMKNSCN